jgi:hypothetical protein
MSDRSEYRIALAAAIVFMLLGLVSMTVGWRLFRAHRALLDEGLEATGTIVGFERTGDGREDRPAESFLVPLVRFETSAGQEIEFLGTVAERFWTDHRVGNSVEVVYDPTNPHAARINEYAEIWFAPAMLLIIGLGAAAIPPFTIWRHYRS